MEDRRLSFLLFISILSIQALCCNGEDTNAAFFIFGDSTVDVGNNNYLETIPPFKANYPPYGQKFFDKPTGRFGEGRVIVDFVAEYAGLPFIPPYADREADFSKGANFGSGGGGILSETNQGMVIDLKTQLQHFAELHQLLSEKMDPAKAQEFFSEAVYFISIGSNDYMGGYLGNPAMQEIYQPEQFVAMAVGNITEAIQVLYSKGARKIAYLGLGPLGCLPALRALANDPQGGCLAAGSSLGAAHNMGLSTAFRHLKANLPDLIILYSNFFDFLSKRIEDPSAHGFTNATDACCGAGPYGGVFNCGGKFGAGDVFELCVDPSRHVWWDSYHPTELIHEQFARAMWNGSSDEIHPFTVRHLFKFSTSSLYVEEEHGSTNIRDQLQFSRALE